MSQQLTDLTSALNSAAQAVTDAATRVANLPAPQPEDLSGAIAQANAIAAQAAQIAPAQP